jgi:pyruvate dehydrogenase (quinone)
MNIAELTIECLEMAGIRRIYGVVGDSLNGITEALRKRKSISWVPVRHEEVAAFAAGAEAHISGELAVCAGSCGPGNLHLINGLYDCHRSRVPVLAIAAHIPSPEIGSQYFQETHPEHLFKECSHFCEVVSHPSQMPRLLEIAMQTALNKRGVSVLVLPGDVALAEAETTTPRTVLRNNRVANRPADSDLEILAHKLNHSRRTTILAGAGCAGAHAELIAIADKLNAPIVHALRGKEFVEYENPFDVGMTGLLGFASGYRAMERCDSLLMLGTDFPYQQFYPKNAWIAQVDSRPEQLGRRARLDLGLVGDVKSTLAALESRLRKREDGTHLRECLEHYASARKGLDELAVGVPGRKPIHPQYLARMIDRIADESAIFTCDVGTPTIWACRYLTMNGKRRLIGSFTHGSMANALPQAIGAQLTRPDRQVISLSGDGGFAMLMGDFLTLRQLNLPVKIVIFNNGSLAFVELEMIAAGLLDHGSRLNNPNFASIAEAAGIKGIRIEDPSKIEPGLRAAFGHKGPAIVDVIVNRQELSLPPKIMLNQAVGFNLYAMRAILNGRGDEIIDLAKTNLLR